MTNPQIYLLCLALFVSFLLLVAVIVFSWLEKERWDLEVRLRGKKIIRSSTF